MTRALVVVALCLGLFVGLPTALAQPAPDGSAATADSSEDRCKAALEARASGSAAPYCRFLAARVATTLLNKSRTTASAAVAAAAAQPRITDTPGAQGSAGQTAAIASGQPVASTGGSVAAVGPTGQGLQLVTALAVNPASIVLGDTSTSSVWASRLGDLSIVLPLDVESGASAKGGVPYIGGRFRLNTLAALHSASLERAVAAYQDLKSPLQEILLTITSLLEVASDPGRCADAIERASDAEQAHFCGAVVDRAALSSVAVAARASLAQFREETDRRYLSLEGRFDHGDLNADAAAGKDSLLAAYLAAGYGFHPTPEGLMLEFRARGGLAYFHDGATDASRSAATLALGAELAIVRDLRRYSLSLALELTTQPGAAPTTSAMTGDAFRIGVGVPLADGKVVSVGLVVPTRGGDSMITLSGDWSALFGK